MAAQATRRTRLDTIRRRVYRLASRCQVCEKPILPGQTWKFTETGGKVHYYCAQQNPKRDTPADVVMRERIHMPGVPQLVVPRAFAWQWWHKQGWTGPAHGIGSLDYAVYSHHLWMSR